MAFESATTNNGGGSDTPSTGVPSGAAAGKTALLLVQADNKVWTLSSGLPTGFTAFPLIDLDISDGARIRAFWKRLTAADSGSYAFGSQGGFSDWLMCALLFNGRHATDDPVASASESDAANTSPVTASGNGLTAVAHDDLVFLVCADPSGAGLVNSAPLFPTPSGYTSRVNLEDTLTPGTGWNAMAAFTKEDVSAGATGSPSSQFTLSSGNAGWGAYHIRIPALDSGAVSDPGFMLHRMPLGV